jgi:hypothetical protein
MGYLSREAEGNRSDLDLCDAIFANQYAGRKNMTAPQLKLVVQAAYCACPSVHQGTTAAKSDRAHALPRGIRWECTESEFLAMYLGLT